MPVQAALRAALLCAFAGAGFALEHAAEIGAESRRKDPLGPQVVEPAATQGEPSSSVEPVPGEARTPLALERGLAWLAAQQSPAEDGSFAAAGGRQNAPVPVAALAALAFMAAGSGPERGPHGANVARAIDYLLARADMGAGSPTYGYISSEGDPDSRMHGHAFATIALAQAWSMSARSPRGKRVAEVLAAAVGLMEKSQGLEGGWMYYPHRSIDHENSVTVVIVQALRAASGAGIEVDAEVIARAVDYIRRCQTEDGSFRYGLSGVGSEKTSVALTAAGLITLNSAGVYEGPEIDRAVEALWRRLGFRGEGGRDESGFPFYERFYLAQALWQHSDTRLFKSWVELEREWVLTSQREDGSWTEVRPLREADFGDCYATAMNCLFLAIPDGLLPIFQR
jgi:hypothetical protein